MVRYSNASYSDDKILEMLTLFCPLHIVSEDLNYFGRLQLLTTQLAQSTS
jgi:hypothetical protein